jgi:hypothetical protein
VEMSREKRGNMMFNVNTDETAFCNLLVEEGDVPKD